MIMNHDYLNILRNFDLNLLISLDCLLEEKQITKAGQRIGLTQSAMSRSLSRLRELFNDELLVRGANGLELTIKAKEIRPELTKVLNSIHQLTTLKKFDPRSFEGEIRISTTDYGSTELMPKSFLNLRNAMPNLKVSVTSTQMQSLEELKNGVIDLIIGIRVPDTQNIHQIPFYTEQMVIVANNEHPLHKSKNKDISNQQYVMISNIYNRKTQIEQGLEAQGVYIDIAMRTPHFVSALEICSNSNLLLFLPKRLAQRTAESYGLKRIKSPYTLPSYDYSLIWHEMSNNSAAYSFIREFLLKTFKYKLNK